MDVLLENLNDDQIAAFKRLAEQLNVGAHMYVRSTANEDFALMQAILEAKSEGLLSDKEKTALRTRLRQA